jgi:hypothetical protein
MDCPVVQVTDAPLGLVEFKIRDSRGKRLALLQVSAADLDDELMEALHDWQARHAHERPDLHVMPASPSLAS